MKSLLIAVPCALLLNCADVNAQGTPRAPMPQNVIPNSEEALAKGQNQFAQYNAKYRNNAQEGRKLLEDVYAFGLPRTAEITKSIRSALASKITVDEKVLLVRVLSRQYTPDNKTGMNSAIVQDLKGLTNSGEAEVAKAATLAYSRLGYFPDHRDVLLAAKNRGLIDSDTYFGELAHVLAFAPAGDQLALANSIKSSKNQYASEILAMTVNNPALTDKFSPETRAAISGLLEEMEPAFSQALGYYDYVDGVRYSEWLRAIANLKGSEFNKHGGELIMAKLDDEKTDPRKIMAFLTSEYAQPLMQTIDDRRRFENMLQRISLYSKQHPQNRDMREITAQIRATLGNLKN